MLSSVFSSVVNFLSPTKPPKEVDDKDLPAEKERITPKKSPAKKEAATPKTTPMPKLPESKRSPSKSPKGVKASPAASLRKSASKKRTRTPSKHDLKPSETWTVAELTEFAEDHGIAVEKGALKADILKACLKAK